MPAWDNCMKIHEGCGGLCIWVEALETPGVGYYGKCMACQTGQIVVEQMIPIEKAKVEAGIFFDSGEPEKLADLEWKEEDSWEENQERLKQEIESLL